MKTGFFLFLLLLSLDFVTKWIAIDGIPPLSYGSYPFGGIGIFAFPGITFSLNYIVNTGAAWGFFTGYAGWLFVFRFAIILAILFFIPKQIPIWLVLAGAVGNAIDYCLYGYVIDFFHFTFWGYSFPIFNVADSCITIGTLALLFLPRKKRNIEAL